MSEYRDKPKMVRDISQKQFLIHILLKQTVFEKKTHFLLFKSIFYFLLNIKIRLVNCSPMSFPGLSSVQKQSQGPQNLINLENICQNHNFSSNTTCANDDDILDQLDFGVSFSCRQQEDLDFDNSNHQFFTNLNQEISQEGHSQKQQQYVKKQRVYLFGQHKMDEQFESQQHSYQQNTCKQEQQRKQVNGKISAILNPTVKIQLNNKNQINIFQNKPNQKKSIFNPTKNIVKTFLVSFAIFMEKNKKLVDKILKKSNVEFFSQAYQQDLKYFRKNIRKNLSLSKLRQMLTTGINQKLYRILTNYYLRKGFLSHLYSPKCKVLGRDSYLNHRQSLKRGFMNPHQFTQFLPFLTNISVQDYFQDEE